VEPVGFEPTSRVLKPSSSVCIRRDGVCRCSQLKKVPATKSAESPACAGPGSNRQDHVLPGGIRWRFRNVTRVLRAPSGSRRESLLRTGHVEDVVLNRIRPPLDPLEAASHTKSVRSGEPGIRVDEGHRDIAPCSIQTELRTICIIRRDSNPRPWSPMESRRHSARFQSPPLHRINGLRGSTPAAHSGRKRPG